MASERASHNTASAYPGAGGAEGNTAGRGHSEEEPLLGSRGDASQGEGESLLANLWIGTAPVAQAGIWILTAVIWGVILGRDWIFFSGHPIFNSAGFLLLVQSILILQPTHTPAQKRSGTLAHLLFHIFGVTALTLGLIIIEINKQGPGHDHFASAHARLGLAFYIFIYLQTLVGFTQYFVPDLYGGVANAKAIYKYHRVGGYMAVLLGLATISASSWTTFSLNALHIEHWSVVTASVLVVIGLAPRIRLSKFGLK